MPQVPPQLSNSSSSGLPPQFTIDDETWMEIEVLFEPGEPGAKRHRENYFQVSVVRGRCAIGSCFDRRKGQFRRLGRALDAVLHQLDEMKVGEGDFSTALVEHHLTPCDLTRDLEKLEKFGDRVRAFKDLVRTAEAACEAGHKLALTSTQAGLQPGKIWKLFVRSLAVAWKRQGHLPSVRKDERGVSAFVRLIDIVQSGLDARYQRHAQSEAALSHAVSSALREGRATYQAPTIRGPAIGSPPPIRAK